MVNKDQHEVLQKSWVVHTLLFFTFILLPPIFQPLVSLTAA